MKFEDCSLSSTKCFNSYKVTKTQPIPMTHSRLILLKTRMILFGKTVYLISRVNLQHVWLRLSDLYSLNKHTAKIAFALCPESPMQSHHAFHAMDDWSKLLMTIGSASHTYTQKNTHIHTCTIHVHSTCTQQPITHVHTYRYTHNTCTLPFATYLTHLRHIKMP